MADNSATVRRGAMIRRRAEVVSLRGGWCNDGYWRVFAGIGAVASFLPGGYVLGAVQGRWEGVGYRVVREEKLSGDVGDCSGAGCRGYAFGGCFWC